MQYMSTYHIQGGKPLSGRISASGNKNAALPCIAAALLSDYPLVLRNVPDIEDVHVMFDIISLLGSKVEPLGDHEFKIIPNLVSHSVPKEPAEAIRASILLAGPLVSRTGQACLSPPGGDIIGLRRLDTHFIAFEAFGATSSVDSDGTIRITAEKLQPNYIFLDEASVTATENALMVAARIEGETTLYNAAGEPHIQDLCHLLVAMGADIQGIGSNKLIINGNSNLQGADFTIGSDYMEIGSFIGLAAVTGGELIIDGVDFSHLPILKLGFRRLGVSWTIKGNELIVTANQRLKVIQDVSGMIPKIDDAPWPGFPADLLSILTVVATQTQGTVLIHEKMFESRMYFLDMLIRMGASAIQCDPHRAIITGPTKLKGALVTSPDVRAGMSLVIAALCAEGESEIQNDYQI